MTRAAREIQASLASSGLESSVKNSTVLDAAMKQRRRGSGFMSLRKDRSNRRLQNNHPAHEQSEFFLFQCGSGSSATYAKNKQYVDQEAESDEAEIAALQLWLSEYHERRKAKENDLDRQWVDRLTRFGEEIEKWQAIHKQEAERAQQQKREQEDAKRRAENLRQQEQKEREKSAYIERHSAHMTPGEKVRWVEDEAELAELTKDYNDRMARVELLNQRIWRLVQDYEERLKKEAEAQRKAEEEVEAICLARQQQQAAARIALETAYLKSLTEMIHGAEEVERARLEQKFRERQASLRKEELIKFREQLSSPAKRQLKSMSEQKQTEVLEDLREISALKAHVRKVYRLHRVDAHERVADHEETKNEDAFDDQSVPGDH